MEELSPEAKSLYEMLMAETREEYESMFMAHKRRILDAVRVKASSTTSSTAPLSVPCDTGAPNPSSSASTSSAPPCVPSSDVSISGISERAAATPSSTPAAAAPQASTPSSALDVSTNLWVRTELDAVHDAVRNDGTDLAAPMPTTCSTDWPSRADVSPVSALISSATPISATATHCTMPESCCFNLEPAADASVLAATPIQGTDPCSMTPSTCSTICLGADTSATSTPSSTLASSVPSTASPVTVLAASMSPAAGDQLEGGDNRSSTSPSLWWIMCPSGGIGTVASEACSVNSVLALGASSMSLTPPAYLVDDITAASATRLTNSAAALLSVKAFTVQKLIGALSQATKIKRPPWPPPWLVFFQDIIRCKNMIQVMLSDDLILESMPLMLWDAKIPGPLPFQNMSASIQNILQLDCHVIPFMPRTALFHLHVESVEFTRSRIGIGFCCFSSQVTTFAPGVQCVQLQAVVFKWSDPYCYSASVDDKLPADHYWLWCMKCVELSRVRVEAYFSLPSVDQGRLKCTKLQNPSCWNGWHSSSLLIHWLHVPCIQLFWGLLCAVQGYVCSSTSVFFANLNGVSAVQHQYTCTKVLMVADYKEWIHHHILLGLLDLALTDWKTWISGLYLWAIYFGASTCGRDVSTLWWLQFAIMNSLCSQDEYTSSFTIGTSLDLMEMGIYYRSTHYTEVHILDAISLWLNTSTSLHGGKLYWLLGLHSSWDQFRTESENCFDSQYFEWQIPWYSILYASSSCGLALFLERFDQDWVLSSPVGSIIQYGSEHILQFVEYNGLTWKYFSYKEIHSEHATHYVSVASPNFGGNGGLIMGFSVKTMEPQQTKLLCCSLLIQWPGVPISAKASFYTTVQNATQNWGVDICGQNWQDSTKLQNHSCWNEWSFLLHIPVHFKLKKYWDPHGVELRLSEAAFVLWLIMLWDPGGSTWCRLEVKPNFKEWGLSATSLVGWLVGRYYWAMAYSGARWECYREQYILGRHLQETWLGTERKRRLRPRLVGACVVCAVFLFLFLLLEP